ncbi:4226_t:CDS:2 [Funneliformis geosporum]|nr:4226_t:CDS:2 [Funneliformis geosporum]
MPPLVLYKIPFIGHTFSYLFDCKEFLKQCRKEYGDIFSLYIWGQVKTFVGKEHAHEVLARDDAFDFGIVAVRKLPIDAMFVNGFGDSRYNIMAVKEYISKKLELYTERMQESLHLSIQRYIEAKSEEIITTFAEFTSSLFIFYAIPPVLDFVYPGLQDYVNRIPVRLGLYDPSARQRSMLIKHIKNQVDKRLREKQEYQDSWKRPNDLLQDFIEEKLFDPNKPNYNAIADKMAFFIFASIHTTSRASTYVLIDLASRPEYIQELYEEQLEIHKETDKNGILPIEAFNKMNKLDSFVKESLRLNENIAGLSHLTLKDYTFSNGLQIPKDHIF